MAKKKAKDGEDKGKGKLVPAIVVGVAVLAAAYFVGPLKGSKGGAGAAGTAVTTTTALGPVVSLEPVTLNLADGHFLKVGVALQLSADAKAPEGDPATSGEWAKALDATISLLGQHTYPQLVAPAARDEAKAQLTERVRQLYEDDVVAVYFTQFVMQ